MPNQLSAEILKKDTDPIWISVEDLDFAYGQMKLAPKRANTAASQLQERKSQRILPIPKGILRPRGHTYIISGKNRPYTRPRNTRMVGRHNNCYTLNKRRIHDKTGKSTYKIRKRRTQSKQEKIKILSERNRMSGTHHHTRRD